MNELQTIKRRFGIVGHSPLLDRALSRAVRVAPTDLTVLIIGESGVGKEAFSKIIHALSPRKHNPFIAVNCGAIPEGTINSELFGHEKGAFTGATHERKGYFETVDGGTIFLDEIGEMPLDTQTYLLRVLESGEFMRVGSSKPIKTNVRVIAATNVDLEQKVKEGKFREDLYYRLSTVPIEVPPLRERKEDILMLFRKFALDFANKYHMEPIRLTEDAANLLLSYHWPGNVRELKNVVGQLSVLAEERLIDAEQVLAIMPKLRHGRLPVSATPMGLSGIEGSDISEREILYKLLFEMKHDLTDLKRMLLQLVQLNQLQIPPELAAKLGLSSEEMAAMNAYDRAPLPDVQTAVPVMSRQDDSRIVVHNSSETDTEAEIRAMEEHTLSLEAMERELIKKALKKHRNRRRDAARELGISERTLYRKIKQYELA